MTVVTVTALAGGAAWERLARAFESGGAPGDWAREVDAMRHDHVAKILAPVPWSALQEIDLTTVDAEASGRPQALYMEDTVSPFPGKLDAYLQAAGTLYARDTIPGSDSVRASRSPNWGVATGLIAPPPFPARTARTHPESALGSDPVPSRRR